MKKKGEVEREYDLVLNQLLQLVKKKGVLVKKMKVEDHFLFNKPSTEYKKDLGAVQVKDIFGKTKSIYVVYEDFDGSIKYYDYPQLIKK